MREREKKKVSSVIAMTDGVASTMGDGCSCCGRREGEAALALAVIFVLGRTDFVNYIVSKFGCKYLWLCF
jgi:hypothetical protein